MLRKPTAPWGKVIMVVGLVAAQGCADREDAAPAAHSKDSKDEAVSAQPVSRKERAIQAKQALFEKLSSELLSAMSTGGPSTAIEVCSKRAPKIAAQIGEQHGLSIGRTSFKLRNAENRPPEWTREFVEQRVEEPRFVELENDSLGAFLPIHLKPQCMVCHGPEQQLSEDVKEQLAQRYPDDQATGFEEGELRGWFWVEVPTSGERVH